MDVCLVLLYTVGVKIQSPKKVMNLKKKKIKFYLGVEI